MTLHLVDKSVWARLQRAEVASVIEALIRDGRVATCAMIDLEILYSARNGDEHAELREERAGLTRLPMPDEVWHRAVEVQGLLARSGRHRAAPIPDLLIAATAEHHGAAVLHYDGDFDLIAEVTGQEVGWVVPRGSVD